MKEYAKLVDVVPAGRRAIAVFTCGKHLQRGKITKSGNWTIDPNRIFDMVVIYLRQNDMNEIILGDWVRTEPSEDRRRYILHIANAKPMGFTRSTWPVFAETGSLPFRYV
jgi:hypothetical protein